MYFFKTVHSTKTESSTKFLKTLSIFIDFIFSTIYRFDLPQHPLRQHVGIHPSKQIHAWLSLPRTIFQNFQFLSLLQEN